ncbi:MAG: hypothetical protein ACI8TP_004471 [Acidimicrobiales bacterium]|jgi:small-conductance mechanosensitive channel
MTMTDWIIVGAALVGGFVLGGILSRVAHGLLSNPARPKPVQESAKPLSSLVFWAGVIGGLMVALGVLQPDALAAIPEDLIAFLPKVISAAIIVIGANVLSSFVLTALGPALSRASASLQRQVASGVKALIVGMATLLAVAQLGIDTTVINLGVAAIFFAAAASFTLLVGLGGREIATEVASSRALKKLVHVGDVVDLADVSGRIVAVHPTAVEIATEQGTIVLVPSSQFTSGNVQITRT